MKLGFQKIFLPGIILTMFLALTFISCSEPSTVQPESDNGPEVQANEETMTEEEIEDLAEAVEEEEIIDLVDYENVVIGAEIKGFITGLLCTNEDNYIKIEITNTSDFTWRASGQNRVAVGYHFYGQDVKFEEYDNPTRSSLPGNVEPGETATVEVLIDNIENKGMYVVQIDMVLENHFWFSSKEVPMLVGKVYFAPCGEG